VHDFDHGYLPRFIVLFGEKNQDYGLVDTLSTLAKVLPFKTGQLAKSIAYRGFPFKTGQPAKSTAYRLPAIGVEHPEEGATIDCGRVAKAWMVAA